MFILKLQSSKINLHHVFLVYDNGHTKMSDKNTSIIGSASATKSKYDVTSDFPADPLSPLLSLSTYSLPFVPAREKIYALNFTA